MFIALVVGLFVYSVVRDRTLSAEELGERGVFILPKPRDIAPFVLENETGETANNDVLLDRWSFVFFGFTNCPDICPTSMSDLAKAERLIRERQTDKAALFQGIMVSVDPERDDTTTLAAYVNAFSPRFVGLRGSRDELARLATQVNAAFSKVPTLPTESSDVGYQVEHTGHIVIINPKGHYHGFIKMPHDADTITATFEFLSSNF